MATDRLQIQFRGLDEGSDPKNLPPGTLLRAENVRMDKSRRLAKRYGIRSLATDTIDGTMKIVSGARLILGGEAPSVVDGNTLYTYSSALVGWQQRDRPPHWQVTRRPLVDSTRSLTAVDCAVYGSSLISFFTVYSTGCSYYQVDDLETGTPVVGPTLVSTSDCYFPRVLVSGTKAYFLYAVASNVAYRSLTLTTLTFDNAQTNLCTGATTSPAYNAFDATIATPTAGVPTMLVSYVLDTGADRLKIERFTVSTMASAGSLTVVTSGSSIGATAIAFGALSQKVAVMFGASTSVYVTSCTAALGSQVGPTSFGSGTPTNVFIAEDTATYWLAGYTTTSNYSLNSARRATLDLSIDTASIRTTFNFTAASRPWRTNGRWYLAGVTMCGAALSGTPPAQTSTIVVELETSALTLSSASYGTHPHAATLENYTGWFGYLYAQVTPVADADGVVWIPAAYRKREVLDDGVNLSPPHPVGWNLYRLESGAGDTHRSARLAGCALVASGAPAWDDGVTAMPYGFAHAPQVANIYLMANGSLTANSTYSYRATYLWVDASGLQHRSAPSPPVSLATTTNRTISVSVSSASVCGKQRAANTANTANPVLVELWRTTANSSGPHYRLTYEPISTVFTNDARGATVSIQDTKADDAVATNVRLDELEQLYTDEGELENIPPPAFTTVTTHRNRLWGIGPDERTVWASKDFALDTTLAPGFNEALTLTFTTKKTALASLDTSLVVLGPDKIDIVNGEGPDDTGGGAWGVQPVQTDVGCINPHSVVATPIGVMFKSRRGIEVLDRGLSVDRLPGKDVTDTLETYPNITSAVLMASESEVRWTCDDGTNGVVLAYDYVNKVWFTRKYTVNDVLAPVFADAAIVNGVYTLLTTGGVVLQETPGVYDDDGVYVQTDIILAPISAQLGKMGWGTDNLAWQRVKDVTVMGTSHANHNLSVSFAHDYAANYSQTHTFTANGSVTAVGPRELARVTVAKQKCQSIQIRIRDLTPTGTANGVGNASAGVTLEAVGLRIMPKEGTAKTSEGQQA